MELSRMSDQVFHRISLSRQARDYEISCGIFFIIYDHGDAYCVRTA